MIKIDNFEKYPASGLSYGGHGGSKKGIIIDDEKWFLKYPKSTKSMEVKGISYTTTPLSESSPFLKITELLINLIAEIGQD